MKIQATTPNFYGKVNITQLKNGTYKTIQKELTAAEGSTASCISGGMSATSTGLIASKASAAASEVASTAFFSEASGINSSGIVPSVIETATPHVTPATIAASQNHPSAVGSFFSTIGQFFDRISSVKVNVKNPS